MYPLSPYFRAPAFLFYLSFHFCLVPPKRIYGQHFFLGSSYILPYFSVSLSRVILARYLVTFSHTALSAMAGNLFSSIFLALHCHFNFLMSLLVSSGCIPSSSLNTVVLGGWGLIIVHGRSRMTIDPRIPTMPGRSTSGFHLPGRHCLHQARSAVRSWASRMKGELRSTKNRFRGGLSCI